MKNNVQGILIIAVVAFLAGLITYWVSGNKKDFLSPTGDYTVSTESRPYKLGLLKPIAAQTEPEANIIPSKNEATESTYALQEINGSVKFDNGKIYPLTGNEGVLDRIFIPLGKPISINISIPKVIPDSPMLILASNGGKLERINGDLKFTPKTSSQQLDLKFTPTLGRGAYTITIRQAGLSVTVDIWAGEVNKIGNAGPEIKGNDS